VECYLRLLRIAFGRRNRLVLDLPPALAEQPFPAGLLLPLSIQLLEGRAEMQMEFAAAADEHCVRVAVTLDAAPADASMGWLSAALDNLYGGAGGCRWRSAAAQHAAGCAVLELEVPRDPS
jgi:hypothetical protein